MSSSRFARGLRAALAGVAMSVAADGASGETPRMLATLTETRADIARNLAATIRRCVERKDTGHAAFHGCIDWHSAVHGAWALTAYGRATGDRQHAGLLARILTPAKVAAEHRLIREQPDFEMPYGRAWFLRLAGEQARASNNALLEPMADDVLASMLSYYSARKPDPRRGSYGSDAWALLNMHAYAIQSGNAAAEGQIRDWVQAHFIRYEVPCDDGLETGHFMAVCTNWAWLVSRVLPQAAFDRWAEAFFAGPGLPKPVTEPVNWHHHGLNFSRAWGLWALSAATGSEAARRSYREAYAAHFLQTYRDPALWRGSYEGVAHWVPQFGMLALQPMFPDR
jgi:hypothetical protein